MNPVNLLDFEDLARAKMPQGDFDFVAGGATDEITLRRSRAVFDSIALRPKRMVNIAARDLSTTVLGKRVALPIMFAPTGGHRLVHEEGEVATARVAGELGIAMALSIGATRSLEDVAKAARGPLWFQHYLFKNKDLTLMMVKRAEETGCSAICITLDSIAVTKRERMLKQNYVTTEGRNSSVINYELAFKRLGIASHTNVGQLIDLTSTWSDLAWLASHTKLPIVAKGILTGDDAKLAAEHGAKAVVVSTHGSRNLDTTLTPFEALPEVAEAVGGRIEVYMDGGVRRGTDVLKALAFGARAVLIGRPIFWGLACDGERGLRTTLEILRDELDLAMALTGRPSIAAIDRSLVTPYRLPPHTL